MKSVLIYQLYVAAFWKPKWRCSIKRCSFNDPSAIPKRIFDFSAAKEHEQLNNTLEKFSNRASADKSNNNSKSVRESVENYIAAALAGDDDKATEYAYPDTAVVAQTNDTREVLQGQDIRILGVCVGEWNALAISSVVQADHGRIGSVVFHLKKVIQDQKTHWLIDDIDLETPERIGAAISYFIDNVPDAKTIVVTPDLMRPRKLPNDQVDVPVGEDKPHVHVDCLVFEIYTSMRLDRETTIAAENLMGEATPSSTSGKSAPTVEEWIREVAGTTVLAEESSIVTGDGQTTRKMVDLLVSRGYMKILMNPTLKVMDGGKGRVESMQKVPIGKATAPSTQPDHYVDLIDYFEITAHVLDDDSIKLLTEGTINRQLPRQDKGQPPIFTKSTFSGNVVLGPGMSLVIGGRQKTDNKTEDSKEPQTKVLFIFTPTIINTAGDKADVQTENAKYGRLTQSEFKINLATGVTVELIGMCEYPSVGRKWWRPDGSPLDNPPYDESNLNILSGGKSDAIPVEFAFRLSGNLGEPAWEAQVKGYDQAFVWWTGRRSKDGEFLTDIKSIGTFVESDRRTINLRLCFSIADGPSEWVEFKNISVKPDFETDTPVKSARSEDAVSQQTTISGRCLDTNGRPVSNTQVLVFCQDYRQRSLRQVARGRTDSGGLFTLGPITPLTEEDTGRKRYLVFVPANGHGPAWKDIHSHRQITDLLELTTYDSAEVAGTIVTEDFEPVAAAHVWVRGIVPPEATEDPKLRENDFHTIAPLPGWSSTTDNDGSFRIAGVPDGARIQLLVSHRDFARSIVYVKPGAVVEIEVLPAAAITGRVLYGKTGKPAAGVKVQAQAVERISVPGGMIMSWAETTTDSQGRYKLESLHGVKHNVWARADDLTVVALDSFKAERGQTRQAPDLLLVEGGFITGRVIDQETGEPVKPGAASDVAIYGPSRPRSGAAVESSHIREDGSFRIRVAPGRNYIYLRGMDDWGRQSAIISPPHHWVGVSNGQTAEVKFKIRKFSPDEIEEAEKRGPRFVMTIPKTLDEVKQTTKRMKQLGVAIAMYTSEHDGALPQTLLQLRGYIRDKQDFIWFLDEVEYIGKGKTAQRNAPQIPIAYDSTLFRESNGTQVLFLDFSVRFLERRKLEELGVEVRTQKRRAPADRWIVLNTAVNMYAEEHNHKLPETLEALKPYVPSERHFQWVVDNVEYLARGQHLGTMRSWAPIACEKTQFENGWFTDTLFRDGHTEGMYPAEIKKLADLDRRVKDSAEKLMYFGRAMLLYANDHDGKYPDRVRLDELREYLKSEESAWPIQPAYLGGGRTTADRPDIVIYYDIELMPYGKGTNVLFNDGHVGFAGPERLNELNINKTQILIETRILTATDDFLKENWLDANSVPQGEIRSVDGHALADSTAEPNSLPYCLILDDLDVNLLLKAMADAPEGKGAKVLAAPQIMVADGRQALIKIVTEEYYFLSPSDPNDRSDKTESKPHRIEVGTSIKLTSDALPDTNNVLLDFEWELRQIRDFKKQKSPLFAVDNIKTTAIVPDGKTLLIGGKKFTEYRRAGWSVPVLGDLPGIGGAFRGINVTEGEQKTLLILVKPVINPEMPPPPKPRSVDPDDPLVKELEKKFERSIDK